MGCGKRRAGDDHPRERLAELQPRARPGLPPELDDGANLRDLGEERVVAVWDRGPAGERCAPESSRPPDEIAPEVVGEERHHRRDDAQRLDERVPERAERLPRRRPRSVFAGAPDVPVLERSSRNASEGPDHVHRAERRLVGGLGLPHECSLRPRDAPSSGRATARAAAPSRGRRAPARRRRCSRR